MPQGVNKWLSWVRGVIQISEGSWLMKGVCTRSTFRDNAGKKQYRDAIKYPRDSQTKSMTQVSFLQVIYSIVFKA